MIGLGPERASERHRKRSEAKRGGNGKREGKRIGHGSGRRRANEAAVGVYDGNVHAMVWYGKEEKSWAVWKGTVGRV